MLLSSVQDQPLDLYFHAGHAGFDAEGEGLSGFPPLSFIS